MEKEIQVGEINHGLRIPGSNRVGAGKAGSSAVLCAPHSGQQGRRGLGERECLGSADGGTRGRGGQRFWGRGAGAGGEGAARRWGRGRRCGAVGEGAVPDAVSGEGEMVRQAVILGRRAPRGGAVVAWWESAVGAGRGRR
jgi:hypothetical protein